MNPPQPSATAGEPDTIRFRLAAELKEDLWLAAPINAVAPRTVEQCQLLFRRFSNPLLPFGSGSECCFPQQTGDIIGVSSSMLTDVELSATNQTISVSAGSAVSDTNKLLADSRLMVPALARFEKGTVGGRLATVPANPSIDDSYGWTQSLLGITVVLSNGDLITAGGHCIKDVAGYDLRQLFPGSRGCFGMIVNAIFRCYPLADSAVKVPAWKPQEALVPVAPHWIKMFDPTGRMISGSCR